MPVAPPTAAPVAETRAAGAASLPPPAPPADVSGGSEARAAAAAATTRPSFDIVRITPQGDAVLAGRAAPRTTVTITDNGRPIAEATSDAQGQWVALPAAPLPPGGQQLALSAPAPPPPVSERTRSGPTVVVGEAPLLVIVPPQPPSASALPSAARPSAEAASRGAAVTATPPSRSGEAAATTAVAILTPPDAAPRVLQGLPAAPAAHPAAGSGRLGLEVVDYDEHGAIRFGGSAAPGASVRAYVDNRAAGDTRADVDGHWSLNPADAVPPGDHRLRIDQIGGSGKVAARVELPFERTSLASPDLREGRIVVQPRATLWRIARQAYGQGVRYTVIYQANRDQIRDPNMIFPGQIFAIPPQPAAPVAAMVSPHGR